MTDSPPPSVPPVQAANAPLSDERQMAMLIYIGFLAAFLFPILALVGVVLAYVNRQTAPDWLRSHYTFQIRTFWIGLLFWAVSIALCVVLIGVPLVLATMVWTIVRCALGINRLMARQAYPNPESWMT